MRVVCTVPGLITVIDEALDIVESYQVRIDDLRFLRGVIPQYVANDFPDEIALIDEAIEKITVAVEKPDEDSIIRFENSVSDFKNLTVAIRKLPLSAYIPTKTKPESAAAIKKDMANKCADILRNLKAIAADWSIYSPSGRYYVLGTARFLLPTDIKNAVVLDATVSESPVAKMLGKKFDIRPLPEGVKNYTNVKMHISYGHDVSKGYLENQGQEHFQAMLDSVMPRIPSRGKTFIHKLHENEKQFHHDSINALNAEMQEVNQQLDKLTDLLLNETINKETYDRKHSQLQTRRKEIAALQDEHQGGNEEFKTALTTLAVLASKAPEIFKSSKTEVKRALMGFVFSNLEMKGPTLCYSLREPFSDFQNVASYKEWLLG